MTSPEGQAPPQSPAEEKPPAHPSATTPKTPWFGAHTGAPLAVLVLATWLIGTAAIRFWSPDTTSCSGSFSPDVWLTGGFTMILAAFLLGGLLGTLPHHRPKTEAVGVWTQVGVTAVVAVIAGALFYETLAVASGSDSMPPITHFVMCIKQLENDWTALVFILAALLAGRWLWHRPGAYLQ